MYQDDDIIAAKATPLGKSAIAIVRMSGAGSWEIAKKCVPSHRNRIVPRRMTHARFTDGEGAVDEIEVAFFQSPNSYTGEDLVEIYCHGGEYISERILKALYERGARPAQPGEFTFRAFLNGKMDLTQAEAVSDIIAAESEKAHLNAIRQLYGGLSKEIHTIREELISILAEIEVEIEFPEEEPMMADYEEWKKGLLNAKEIVDDIWKKGKKGKAVREGFRVVIAGPPNSGKSTLLNSLLGEERAIVHQSPGTTRDVIREATEMGGIKVWLTDTAGLREEKEEIEAEGIRRAEKEIETANLIIYLFDLGIGIENNVKETLKNSDFLLIGNKLDIFSGEDWKCDLKISALRGDGLFELREMIAQKAYDGNIEGEIIANERHMEALKNASMALANAIKIAEIKGETELLALEIREASQALGNIVGEGVTEEVLERIFSRFCIGK